MQVTLWFHLWIWSWELSWMCCCWPIGSAVLTAGLQEARQGGVTPPEQTIGRTGSIKPPQDGAIKPEVCLHARLENKTLLLHSFTEISCRLTRRSPKCNLAIIIFISLGVIKKAFIPIFMTTREFWKTTSSMVGMIVLKCTVCVVTNKADMT